MKLVILFLGHISLTDGTSSKDEEEADLFARNVLIPDYIFEILQKMEILIIIRFSKKVDIDAGIVVGRLQKKTGFLIINIMN